MAAPRPIALSGAPGSPYTRKMVALLRYRRLPYRLLPTEGPLLGGLPAPKVRLLPTFYLPDTTGVLQAVTDSTPIIRRLESEHAGRSVIPADSALRFIDELIEDYGDEWLTKAMFHYRWAYADDIAKAGRQLPLWRNVGQSDAELAATSAMISQRQIGRLHVVGSNPTTGPIIEASYGRFLEIMERQLQTSPFLFGRRPASADFALYGQLTQLAQFDPTPMSLTVRTAPRVYAWVDLMEDQSGLEPTDADWSAQALGAASLKDLLREIGRGYTPVMLANARAVASGATQVEAEVDGAVWVQQPFPYQAKCLKWLRDSYAALDTAARKTVDAALADTGCEALFA